MGLHHAHKYKKMTVCKLSNRFRSGYTLREDVEERITVLLRSVVMINFSNLKAILDIPGVSKANYT